MRVPSRWHGIAAFVIAASWLSAMGLLIGIRGFGFVLDDGTALVILVPMILSRWICGAVLTWRGSWLALSIVAMETYSLHDLHLTGRLDEVMLYSIPVTAFVMSQWNFRAGRHISGVAGTAVFGLGIATVAFAPNLLGMSIARVLIALCIVLSWGIQLDFALWPLRSWRADQREGDATR